MTVSVGQTPRPVCSVCIANYNGESLLADCLDSVLSQTGDFDLEVIVHDDASTDASVPLVRERYPTVRLMESRVNLGFCAANNRMAEAAGGDFLLLLNNDAALHPGALETLLAFARTEPSGGILSLPQYDWETGTLVDRGCLLDPFYNPVPNLDPQRRDVAYVIGACLWIPRPLWRELGGFPEWMGSLAEDLYLGCRARLAGYPVRVPASSGYRHRQGASFGGNRVAGGNLQTTYRRRAFSERNKTSALVICTPTVLVWPLLAAHLAVLAAEGVALALLKRDRRIWSDIYRPVFAHVIGQRGLLLRQRRRIQAGRRIGLGRYLSAIRPMPRKLALLLRYGLPAIR